jgi:preprotein translocase SecE subunit
MNLTIAVIGMTLAMAIFLGAVDGVFDQIITKLLGA